MKMSGRSLAGFRVVVAAGSVALCGTFSARAQDAEGKLEEVIVTAQKRPESLLKSAAAITSVQGDALEQRVIQNVQDLRFQAPGLQFSDVSGTPFIGIRGISMDVVTGDADAPVGVYVDGVYQARPTQTSMNLADLQGIEVLRGPQGTLYGRNATGGAINLVTRKPESELAGELRVGSGDHDRMMAGGFLNVPLGDEFAMRISANYEERDGFLRNAETGVRYNNLDTVGGRVAARWTPTGDVTADLAMFAQRDEMVGPIYQTLTQPTGLLPPGSYTLVPYLTMVDEGHTPHGEKKTLGATATINWTLDWASFSSITAYVHHTNRQFYDADGSSFFLYRVDRPDGSDSYSQEFNVASLPGSPASWVGGVVYFNERYDAGVPAPLGPFAAPATLQVALNDMTTDTWALFGDATVPVSDRWSVILGARGSIEERVAVQTVGVEITGLGLLASCNRTRFERKDEYFTPKGGLQFDVSDDQMAYIQVTRGYKSGGYNTTDCGDTFEPEYVTSYEVGYKRTFSDGRARFAAAMFYYDYTDLQVSQILALPTGASVVRVENAPSATLKGGEAELSFQLLRRLQVDLSVSILDATYREFFSTDGLGGPVNENLNGHHLPRSPAWTASLGVENTWTTPLGDLTLRAEAYHTAHYYFREFNRPGDRQADFTIGNVYASVEMRNGMFARVYAKNVTDELYVQELISSEVAGDREGNYAPPRTVGIDLGFRF